MRSQVLYQKYQQSRLSAFSVKTFHKRLSNHSEQEGSCYLLESRKQLLFLLVAGWSGREAEEGWLWVASVLRTNLIQEKSPSLLKSLVLRNTICVQFSAPLPQLTTLCKVLGPMTWLRVYFVYSSHHFKIVSAQKGESTSSQNFIKSWYHLNILKILKYSSLPLVLRWLII